MFSEIKNSLSVIAPTIATALGGPLAGAAVTAIEKALGVSDSSPDQLKSDLANISTDPELQLKIKQADNDFKISIEQIYNQRMQIQEQAANAALADEANARNMQNDAVNKVRIELIRWFGVLTFFVWGFTFYLYMKQTIQGDEGYMIGALNAAIISIWGMIIGFYFGTGVDKVMHYFDGNRKN